MVQLIKDNNWLRIGRSAVAILVLLFASLQIQAQTKNVLIIAVDDLKPAIKAFGDDIALTPNMDQLANQGIAFINAYTQQAVCAPSRASLLTGIRPDRTEVWDLKTLIRDRNPDIITLPHLFKSNGYQTHAIGKVFDPRSVDKGHDRVSWTIPYVNPTSLPGPEPKPYMGSYQSTEHVAQLKFYAKLADSNGLKKGKKQKFISNNYKPSTESADVPDDAYVDGRIANSAIEKLDELSKTNDPFMLIVGFKKPHLPFVAPKKYWDLYKRKNFDLAEWQKRAKGSTPLAYHGLGELGSYTDIPETVDASGRISNDKQSELIHGYYASVSYIDAQIGKVMAKLKETGQLENTIIVFWGDHGFHLGDHNLWCKHTNFEQATRTPLIIVDPSKTTKGVNTIPVELLDIFPTICELTGIAPTPELQGISLVPALEGKDVSKTYAISQWPSGKNGGMGYSIRTERYRYTEWYETYKSNVARDEKQLLAAEMYDYKDDYNETKNLLKSKDHAGIVSELSRQLHNFLDAQVKGTTPVSSEKPGDPHGKPLRILVDENFEAGRVYIGAIINTPNLGTDKADLLAKQFSYTTPENAAKQSAVHPKPGVWNWQRIDDIVKYSEKNNITVRLHGPISPQASRWAKGDDRKPDELLQNMTEYMTEQCKRYNGNSTIKWMDVVNETVTRKGEWFGPKPGVTEWENPWLTIGKNDDGSDVPLYITKAFEIATKNAPDLKLVYNQHGAMEPIMWEKVKKTILYLRKKGYRIDGLGWQAHIKSTETLAHDAASLKYLAELIDWAQANKLEFHVTEIDYKTIGDFNIKAQERQATAYTNVLKVLLSKRNLGVVTYNTWGLNDGEGKFKDAHPFIFDEQLRAKPAYYAIQKLLSNPDNLELVLDGTDDNLLKTSGFEEEELAWTMFGKAHVALNGMQRSGSKCIQLDADRSGARQVINNLKPSTEYKLSAWLKSKNGDRVVLKVTAKDMDPVVEGSNSKEYKKVELVFTTGTTTKATIMIQKWGKGDGIGKYWADDFILIEL